MITKEMELAEIKEDIFNVASIYSLTMNVVLTWSDEKQMFIYSHATPDSKHVISMSRNLVVKLLSTGDVIVRDRFKTEAPEIALFVTTGSKTVYKYTKVNRRGFYTTEKGDKTMSVEKAKEFHKAGTILPLAWFNDNGYIESEIKCGDMHIFLAYRGIKEDYINDASFIGTRTIDGATTVVNMSVVDVAEAIVVAYIHGEILKVHNRINLETIKAFVYHANKASMKLEKQRHSLYSDINHSENLIRIR